MPVKESIIKNDLATADEQKKKIEADQRIRQRQRLDSGQWKDTQYFHFHEKHPPPEKTEEDEEMDDSQKQEEEISRGIWEFKDNFSIDQEYITSMLQESEQIRSKLEAERAEHPQVVTDDTTTPDENQVDSTCNLQ